MEKLRPIWRFLFFAAYTSVIVAEIWLKNKFAGIDMRRSMSIRRRWAIQLLKGVGVRVQQKGDIPQGPCIIICNHRSYLDPILMLQHVDAYPVAKAELADWPLIGKGAKMAGILYLKRDNAKSRAGTLQGIQDIIASGFQVIIFPEGTTSGLAGTMPFKRGVFQLAAKMNIRLVPAALIFPDKADYWIGSESFVQHAARSFLKKEIIVSVHYGPPVEGTSPERLLEHCKTWIDETLLNS